MGKGGRYADAARAGGFVAIGWQELGELSWLTAPSDEKAARARLHDEYVAAFSQTGIKAAIGEGQVWRFVHEIKSGDIVLLPHAAKGLVHIGEVQGEYVDVPQPTDGCPFRQRRAVKWIRDVPRAQLSIGLLNTLGSLVTVFSVDKRSADIREVLGGGEATPSKIARPKGVVEHILDRLHSMHPREFEAFVAAYFVAIGYDAEPTQYVSDGGIDVAGTLDAEGLAEVVLRVQVKRTKSNVGIETVLKTRGALAVDEQGAIISLGGFTEKARMEAEAAGKKTIVLVEGEDFVAMLLEHWEDLDGDARKLLGIRPKERLPAHQRFLIDDSPPT